MIEIKISQGVKQGHHGVLPAAKNDEEIAEIRGVSPHTDILSPLGHSAFNDAKGLLQYIEQLRKLSNGKPVYFSNYVVMPCEETLIFVLDTLNKYKLKKEIKVITATKIFTAFDIFKAFCIGADVCNSGRDMMLALGCIQSLKFNTNECPTE